MRRAWNHALSQARARRRRRRWGVPFFWRLRLWTLAVPSAVLFKPRPARSVQTSLHGRQLSTGAASGQRRRGE